MREKLTQEKLTRAQIARVQATLAAAIESLISMRLSGAPAERAALLREAAALLQDVHRHWRFEKPRPDFTMNLDSLAAERYKSQTLALLRDIQAQAGQLRRLTDAALGLCRGWLAVTPPLIDEYTSEGVWTRVREPGQLRVNA